MLTSTMTSETIDVLLPENSDGELLGRSVVNNMEVEEYVESSDNIPCVADNPGVRNIEIICEPLWNSISPVTHIEIIKSNSRRVTGANRVVPLLTNTLQAGRLAVTNSGLAEVYKSFLYDLENCDNNRKCLLCQQMFLSCTELEHHVKGVHNLNFSANQCFVCRKKYVFQEQLGDHLKQIHGIHCPDLICKLCFMEFGTCIEQKAHERKHEQSFVCHICSEKFSMDYLYQKHLNQHLILHENRKDCKKCGRRFKTSISLDLHEKRHVHIECTVCGSVFDNDLDILVHLKNHETDEVVNFLNLVEQIDQNEDTLEGMLASYSAISKRKTLSIAESECSTLMKDVSDCLTDIVTAVSQNDTTSTDKRSGIECKLCGKNMSSNTELLEHRHNFHLRNRTCPFCGKRNRSVSQTWRHMQSHIVKNKNSALKQLPESQDLVEESSITKIKQPRTNTRLYSCNLCSRKFLYPGSRDNHVLQHSKDKCESWKCIVCEEEFSHPGLLISHSSVHPSVKCNVCDKVFSSQSSLQSHLKSHSNYEKKRKHKCSFCSVECPTLFGLQAHIRCHTGERPYTCGQCQRRFKRLQAVKKHIQVVHNSASLEYHSCSICQKTFNSPANLIRHYLRIHCHVRRFICGICGSRFSQNQDLRRHFKVSHELDMPNINGTDRKKLKEIYVIPSIDNLPEKHPHAIKINSIVAEEKAKFKGLSELMTKKNVDQEDSQGVLKSIGQFIQEFSAENEEHVIELAPTSSGRNNKAMIDGSFSDGKHECSQNSILTKENNANEKLFIDNEMCNSKVILCEICGKKCFGEKEYLKHTPSGNIYVSCNHCESRFCDDVLLSYHISSEHTIVSCNSDEALSKKDNILQDSSVNGPASFKHILDMSCGLNEQICTLEQNNSLLVTSSENIFTIVPDPTIHIDTISSENIHSVSPNTQTTQSSDAHVPTSLNINGFVVQNIIFQQTPAILQTVPLTFSNHELMNSSSISPVLTLNSVPFVSDLQTKPYLLNMTKNQKMTSMNKTNLTKFISEDVIDSCKDISVDETDKTCGNNQLKECEVNLENTIELSNSNREEGLKVTIDALTHEGPNEEMVNDEPKEANYERSRESTQNIFPSNGDKKHSTGTKPYGCHHCGKHFSEKCNLKVHLMVHTGERPFTCEECGKRIRYRKDVLDHKRMHLGEKPFSCDECGRKFLRKRELNRHKIIHTGKKKHKCPICGKAFARLDLLKLGHLPTHIEDKSKLLHSCNVCHKSFKLKSKLKQHEILHSGLKEFQCHICQKRFALGSYLRTHLHLHLKKDKNLKCNICHHQFATKTAFKSHKETCQQRPTKNKNRKLLKDFPTLIQNNLLEKGNAEMETGIGRDMELQDVDLSMLDADSCNAVIYLQMTPEDLKLSFGRSDD